MQKIDLSWLAIANKIYQDDSIPDDEKSVLIQDCKTQFDNQVSNLTIPNVKGPILPIVSDYDDSTRASMMAAQKTIERKAREKRERQEKLMSGLSDKVRRMLEIMTEEKDNE